MPDRFILEAALDRISLDAAGCIVIGDRLMTNIRIAIDAGMPSTLVLTGETTLDVLVSSPENHPTWVIERVDEVLPQDVWRQNGWTTGAQ